MDFKEAIQRRYSSRAYLPTLMEAQDVEKIKGSLRKYNEISGLHMQLILNNNEAFQGLKKSYGFFSGVKNYIALVGREEELTKEKIGYYGEILVLESTCLGLGTCWVGGTFDRKNCFYEAKEDEILHCVIVIGPRSQEATLRERVIRKAIHRKTKSAEDMSEVEGTPPKWFLTGMKAVERAPSAVNQQGITFFCQNGEVRAENKKQSPYIDIDRGIAKLHFEIGAGGGTWKWGNGECFTKAD